VIAKGAANNSGAKLAAYMVRAKDGEQVELYQVYGFATGDIHEAFRSIDAMAKGTRVQQPFFHVAVRNREGEELSRADWVHSADRIEEKLGLAGQGRAIAIHRDEKTGHEHMHVAWSRIDDETLKAIPLPFFKTRLKEVSRELEIELGLSRVSSERSRPERAPSRAEEEQSRRLGTDLHGVRGAIREAYEQSDSGKAFAAALADKGLTLCQGERRDFVVIDQEGGMHALGKRLLGDSAAEVRRGLSDLHREGLPTVEEAREHLLRATPAITLPVLAQAREDRFEAIAEHMAGHGANRAADLTVREVGDSAGRVAGKAIDIAVGGLDGVVGAVGRVAAGLESFLFGGTKAPAPEPTASLPAMQAAPAPTNAEARAFRREADMSTPAEALQSADFQARKDTYTLGVKPELVEAMRRRIEQERERKREREDDERDRER
jgi:hypothetical protein